MIKYGFEKQGKGLNQGDELARGIGDEKRHPIKLERTLLLLIKTKRIIITPTYCHNDIIMIKISRSISEICFRDSYRSFNQ